MIPSLDDLIPLVAECARAEILPRFRRVGAREKGDGSLVTEADEAMQRRLAAALAARWPDYRLLGEEMAEAEQAALLAAPGAGLWCLDPLDGTTNFAAGIPYFAVALALLDEGGVALGIVHDPIRGETFSARRGEGAWLDGAPLRLPPPPGGIKRCVAEVDLKRLPAELAARVAVEHPFASQRQLGSAALDWCWLAAGRLHLYLHGGQRLWDYAAASLILAEAGGRALTLEGEEVYCKTLTKRSVAAAGPELFDEWWAWLKNGD